MKIKAVACGSLGRAQRPAPLKEELFGKLETGNQQPIFLTTDNFIFSGITISYTTRPQTMKIKIGRRGDGRGRQGCRPYGLSSNLYEL